MASMKRIPSHISTFLITLIFGASLPFAAFAGSISAAASSNSIDSLDKFRITMTSEGVNSCTWSRLNNNTTWEWKDQPLPSGTSYDSGELSGWAGPAVYEWQFTCVGDWGVTYFATVSVGISGDTGSFIDDVTNLLGNVIDGVVGSVTNPDPATIPIITVSPSPLHFNEIIVNETKVLTVIVTNTGGASSLLTGSVTLAGDPSFTCLTGCTYSNITPGTEHPVTIKFTPASEGIKTTNIGFSGGGDVTVPGTGTGVTPPSGTPSTPTPIIAVTPNPTLFFYGVELGDTLEGVFRVKNIGPDGTLLSGSATVQAGMGFSCVSCGYTNIGHNEERDVVIRFAPIGSAGTRIATVNFSGGGNAERFVNGEGQLLSITERLDFPPTVVERTEKRTLRISNPSFVTHAGAGTLIVPPPFSCVGVCTYNLPPRTSQDFTIAFTPTVLGPIEKTATLSNFSRSTIILTGGGIRQSFKIIEQ